MLSALSRFFLPCTDFLCPPLLRFFILHCHMPRTMVTGSLSSLQGIHDHLQVCARPCPPLPRPISNGALRHVSWALLFSWKWAAFPRWPELFTLTLCSCMNGPMQSQTCQSNIMVTSTSQVNGNLLTVADWCARYITFVHRNSASSKFLTCWFHDELFSAGFFLVL
jgi:hypothetical protein